LFQCPRPCNNFTLLVLLFPHSTSPILLIVGCRTDQSCSHLHPCCPISCLPTTSDHPMAGSSTLSLVRYSKSLTSFKIYQPVVSSILSYAPGYFTYQCCHLLLLLWLLLPIILRP
jgi:hypothetical protein